jgi:hypothetical protein
MRPTRSSLRSRTGGPDNHRDRKTRAEGPCEWLAETTNCVVAHRTTIAYVPTITLIPHGSKGTRMTAAGVSGGVLAPRRIGAGIIGGFVGGAVFGILLQITDMMPLVAMVVGSESAVVGWLVHLVISAFTGVAFAVLFGRYGTSVGIPDAFGAGQGAVGWAMCPVCRATVTAPVNARDQDRH